MAADLQIRIGAELTEIKGALAGLQRDLKGVGNTKTGNPLKGVEGGAKAALASVGRLVVSFATLAAVIKAIGTADELTTLNARLKIATSSTDEYVRAQQALFDMAQRTRSSLNDTVDLYAKIALSVKEAGVGQETLLQVVETVNQAVQLSGAGTAAAQAALTQLGQGLASGTLRGEELNSILEQTPALADAIAKGMGITRGELRKYGEEGKITSQQVIEALQRQREAVQRDFDQLPLTVGQAVTQLANSGKAIVGAFNEASGATSGLAEALSGLATYLSSDEFLNAAIETASIWSQSFKLIIDDANAAVDIIRKATADIGGDGEDLIALIGRAFRELPLNLRTTVKIVTAIVAGMVDSFIADATLMKEAFAAIFTDDTIEAAVQRRNRRVQASLQAVKDSIAASLAERQAALDEAKKVAQAAQDRRTKGRQTTSSTGSGNFLKRQSDADKAKADQIRKAQLDAEEKLLKDSSKRQLNIIEQLYEDAQITIADYYQRRADIEVAELDRSIAIEQERAKAGGAERVKALAEITILERQKTDVVAQAVRDRAKAEKDVAKELQQAQIQDLQNQGRTAEAARLQLEEQYKDLIARLTAQGDTDGVALIKKLINTGVAKAQFDELKAQADAFIADLDRKRADIERRVKLGVISPAQGRQEEGIVTSETAAKLAPVSAELTNIATTLKDPALIASANAFGDALVEMADRTKGPIEQVRDNLTAALADMQANMEQMIASSAVDAFTNLFTDLASGTKSAGDALRDFVRGFVASMAQIAARALATFLVLKMLDAIYPGLGKATAAGMQAGVKHSGGIIGHGGGTTRNVNPLMFAGAPRYHSGGMVGLKPDERPAILQTGEEVLSRRDPRNAANGAGGSGAGTRIINVIDPSLVSDYMTSSAGEKTVLNILQRNAGAVRQVLT
jgi:tape measure domain-containing protein